MIVVEVGVKTENLWLPLHIKNHQNDVNKWVHTVHTRELNWLQNNPIFVDSIVNLTKINKKRHMSNSIENFLDFFLKNHS
jgi:hypothetical protein